LAEQLETRLNRTLTHRLDASVGGDLEQVVSRVVKAQIDSTLKDALGRMLPAMGGGSKSRSAFRDELREERRRRLCAATTELRQEWSELRGTDALSEALVPRGGSLPLVGSFASTSSDGYSGASGALSLPPSYPSGYLPRSNFGAGGRGGGAQR